MVNGTVLFVGESHLSVVVDGRKYPVVLDPRKMQEFPVGCSVGDIVCIVIGEWTDAPLIAYKAGESS